MSSNYPTTKDVLPNPLPTDKVDTVLHSNQHSNANDAIEAIQDKVGITDSEDTDSLDYQLNNTSSVSPGHKHEISDNTDVDTTGVTDGQVFVYESASSKWKPADTDAPDASTTVKGVSKLATAPASPTNPIAVGDNDPRVPTTDENDALVGNNTDIAVGSSNKFVTQTGLQDGAEVFGADAEASDTYVITLSPVPTALETGMVINFKANTVNTGACTLNVNGLGAKSITSRYNKALFDGDILANQIVTVVYNGTNFQMLSNPSQLYELESSSTNIQASADTERTTVSDTYAKIKEISVDDFGGIIHTTFQAKTDNPSFAYVARIYINGSAVGTERSGLDTVYTTYTEDISVSVGDLIQVYAHRSAGTNTTYIQNFRIGFNIIESIKTDVSGTTVITD